MTTWLTEFGVHAALDPVHVPARPDLGLGGRFCFPIRYQGRLLGFAWFVEGENPLAPDLVECVKPFVDEIAPLLHLEGVLASTARRAEQELIDALLEGDTDASATAAQRALAYGRLPQADGWFVTVVQCLGELGAEPDLTHAVRVLERVQRALPPHHALIGVHGNHGVGIFPDSEPAFAALDLAIEAIANKDETAGALAACGPAVGALPQVRTSWKGAVDAYEVACGLGRVSSVMRWERLGSWAALCRIPNDQLLGLAEPAALRQLDAFDDSGAMLQTLEAFLDSGGDAVRAAATLNVHRTSLYARLRRIADVTGSDLSDGEVRLELHVSLRLRRLRR